jgi:hypothetical protein
VRKGGKERDLRIGRKKLQNGGRNQRYRVGTSALLRTRRSHFSVGNS